MTGKLFAIGISAMMLLISGCASRQYEADRTDPNYQQGKYFPVGTTPEDAVAGLVATGVTLAANRDYYKANGVSGRCMCRGSWEKSTMELPCTNIEVVLTDPDNKEMGRVQTSDGQFAFVVKHETPYRVQISSNKYRLSSPSDRNLYLGDDIVLHLIRQ